MGGPNLFTLAWRNLWRHRRRTLITLSSIAFGTMLAVLFTGLGDSNWSEMIDLAARMGGGHVTLQHPEYLDTPTFGRTVRGVDALRRGALEDDDVVRAVPRISGQIMLATAGHNRGAAFIAFDPAQEDLETLSVLDALAAGEPFASRDAEGIVLGTRLAEQLKAPLGRKVVYTLTDRDGEIVQEATRVTGILETGSPSVDTALVLLPIASLQRVLGYEADEVVQVAIFVDDQRRSERVADRLAGSLGADVAALPWYEISPDLSAFIAMKVAGAQFMELVIMLVIAAGIFNTLFVSVLERTREFGIMMALGFSPRQLFSVVMLESLWLGLCGLALSAAMTALPYYYLATTGFDISSQLGAEGAEAEVAGVALSTVMHVRIFPESLALIAGAALLATLLAGVYPAWRAGRVEPVETIRVG